MEQFWTNIKNPGAFSGAQKLYTALNRTTSKREVDKFLKKQFTYQLHKPIRKRFQRQSIIVSGPNVMWDVDLLDLKEFRRFNYKNRYILTVIDVFSRKAYGQAMTNKTAKAAAAAFDKILSESSKPLSIRTDHGNEFKREFNSLLKNQNIEHILTSSPETKANYVERFHRTFRGKLSKYMTYYNTKIWLNSYQKIIDSYNNTTHRSLGNISPNSVNDKNVGALLENMLHKSKIKTYKEQLKVGDFVRITTLKAHFSKGSKETFTDEVFKISEVKQGNPKVYKLVDLMNEPITGSFYDQELQLADPSQKRVEKAINMGKNKYKVQFKNWPKKFNTTINKAELKFYERPK